MFFLSVSLFLKIFAFNYILSYLNCYLDFLFTHTFQYIIFHPFAFKFFCIFCVNLVFYRQILLDVIFSSLSFCPFVW